MSKPKTSTPTPAAAKLLAGLARPTRSARQRAEAELGARLVAEGNSVDGAEALAPPLLELALAGGQAGGAAMRLLGHLVSEGDRAISTGPLADDPLLAKINPPHVELLRSKKMRSITSALADAAPRITKLLSAEEAEVRGSAAFLLAHIPEAGSSLAKLNAAARKETDVAVQTAMTFAGGFLARYAGKAPQPAPKDSAPTVRAAGVLAGLVADQGKLGEAEQGLLLAAIPEDVMSAEKLPWRQGYLDKVVSNVVGNRVSPTVAALLNARSAKNHPEHERSITWAAATLALGFQEREELLTVDELSDEQRTMLADVSVRDWKQLNPEFPVFGLPPHARDRLALLAGGGASDPILERRVKTSKGSEKLLSVLQRFEKHDAPYETRHAFLAGVLTPSEHLEVARLAATNAMGLQDLGDAQAIELAAKDPAACAEWAARLLRDARRPAPAPPRGDLWLTIALFIELQNGTRTTVEPELDWAVHADGRAGVVARTVLAATPTPRREALLTRTFAKEAMTNLVAFLPLVPVCPTKKVVDLFLQATNDKTLATAFGQRGCAQKVKTKVLPHLDPVLEAVSGPLKKPVEQRAAELRALAATA